MTSPVSQARVAEPRRWAADLGISEEAVRLYLASDVLDLHLDSFIWNRILRWDLRKRHGGGLFGSRFYSMVDFPRVREARPTGAIWVITTNPLRSATGRARAFEKNLARLTSILESVPDDVAIVRDAAGYRRAVAAGKHAAFLGIQGGNALDAPGALDTLDQRIVRVTLVHLSTSSLGVTSPAQIGPDLSIAVEDVQSRFGRTLDDFIDKPTGTMAVVLSRQIVLTPEQKKVAVQKLREAFAEHQRQKAEAGR